MTEDMLSWLRREVEARLATARAAADKPRHIPRRVSDPSAPWGTRWEHDPVTDGGIWVYEQQTEGYNKGQDRVASPAGENLGIVAGSCSCCGYTAEGRTEDLLHVGANDPRDTIARCEAELALLDELLPELESAEEVIRAEWNAGPDLSGALIRTLLAAYQHRPGYNPAWAPEGTTP